MPSLKENPEWNSDEESSKNVSEEESNKRNLQILTPLLLKNVSHDMFIFHSAVTFWLGGSQNIRRPDLES